MSGSFHVLKSTIADCTAHRETWNVHPSYWGRCH